MKQILVLLLLSFMFVSSYAQLDETKNDIILKNGFDYETVDDGSETHSILYLVDEGDDSYMKFFTFKDDICVKTGVVDKLEYVSNYVELFNDDYYRVNNLLWKDLDSNLFYEIEIVDKFIIISIY